MNNYETEENLDWLIGETLTSITYSYNTVNCQDSNSKKYELSVNEIEPDDEQDWTPDVYISGIHGDFKNLIGDKIIDAEEIITDRQIKFYNPGSPTATYRIATKKGAVDITFYKASKNEHGARVNFYKLN